MISTKDAAKQLGITEARVRAMLKSGVLSGSKIGRTWIVSEQDVYRRLREKPSPGRPRRDAERPQSEYTSSPAESEVETAHRLFDECRRFLAGRYDAAFLSTAKSPEEERFFVAVSDFFLQERQRQLIDDGVF